MPLNFNLECFSETARAYIDTMLQVLIDGHAPGSLDSGTNSALNGTCESSNWMNQYYEVSAETTRSREQIMPAQVHGTIYECTTNATEVIESTPDRSQTVWNRFTIMVCGMYNAFGLLLGSDIPNGAIFALGCPQLTHNILGSNDIPWKVNNLVWGKASVKPSKWPPPARWIVEFRKKGKMTFVPLDSCRNSLDTNDGLARVSNYSESY